MRRRPRNSPARISSSPASSSYSPACPTPGSCPRRHKQIRASRRSGWRGQLSLLTSRSSPLGDSRLASASSASRDAGAPMFGRHHDLVEIHRLRIDGDEADQRAVALPRSRHARPAPAPAPALAPPVNARIEIDVREMMRPGAPPQFDRRVFVGGGVGAQGDCVAHRSVSLNSMRRLRR